MPAGGSGTRRTGSRACWLQRCCTACLLKCVGGCNRERRRAKNLWGACGAVQGRRQPSGCCCWGRIKNLAARCKMDVLRCKHLSACK